MPFPHGLLRCFVQVCCALVLVGCAGESLPTEDPVDVQPEMLRGECDAGARTGTFEIAHRERFSAVSGQVADGVNPSAVLSLVREEGECRLFQKVQPFCSPACGGGEVCDTDGVCIAQPENLNAGTVAIHGLIADLVLEPNAVNGYQASDVPAPPFAAGDSIVLTAEGADVGAFELYGIGVQVLTAPGTEWVIASGVDLVLEWTAAGGTGRIRATLNVDQHGTSPVTMRCDFEDTGRAAIPSGLIDELLSFGISGLPTANLYRQTVDSVATEAGCVELSILSHIEPLVTVR